MIRAAIRYPYIVLVGALIVLVLSVRTNRDPSWRLLFTLVFWKPNPAVFSID